MANIGVFVCWCGSNIAQTVDVGAVAKAAGEFKDVVYAVDYKYMCSSPGQNLMIDAIKTHNLDGVVIASCSPRMHESTFRSAAVMAGFNPYMVEMANLREHCSWVHDNREEATKKAIELVRMLVAKVARNAPLNKIHVPVTRRALVIGGGIAGIQAALDIANGGVEVIMVEKEPSIGGHMSQLDETFPTLDCSQCILTPRMVEVATHKNITLYAYSEVDSVQGFVGNFKVKIRRKAKCVIEEICTGCGLCTQKCPVGKKGEVMNEFELGMAPRPAIYTPFPQAVPNIPVIDKEHCTYFKTGKCGVCEKVCVAKAIDFKQEDKIIEVEVGAIIVATGYDLYGKDKYAEYGYGKFKDVISGLEFERMVSASGPTKGKVQRPSNGKAPKNVVFIKCVGSRDEKHGISYCSKICCMYTAKHAMLLHHKCHGAKAYIFYMDIRATGKGYEEFVKRAMEEEEAIYIRGRVSRIYKRGDSLVVVGADTLTGQQVEVEADLVVLATAIVAKSGADKLAQMLNISYDTHNFYNEAHPKLRPVETNTAGIFLAGCCQAPKDIPDSVSQGSAAASKALAMFSNKELEREPLVSRVIEEYCVGCLACQPVCPYNAIEEKEIKDRKGNLIKKVAHVNEGLCMGCGACAVTCRSGCIVLDGFTNNQIFSQISTLENLITKFESTKEEAVAKK
ncbi:MAG: CoB--CoM heterodisulfide reductase iron-sulfur subunit A family protein [Candidatus Eremiobacterota bacterium]